MFFTLGLTADARLPHHEKLGKWVFSHDNGWHNQDRGWYKGYDDCWTRIVADNNNFRLEHDAHRAYPLWWDSTTRTLTNLLGSGEHIWSDQIVGITQGKLDLTRVPVTYGTISADTISLDEAASAIIDRLIAKLHTMPDLPARLFVTGGVDTALLYALVRDQKKPCEIVTREHIEYDAFIDRNFDSIKQHHWGYTQIHHWRDPCVLLTGSCGDEFFMRGPNTVSLWAAWHDIDLPALIESSKGYHSSYFSKPQNMAVFAQGYRDRHQIKQQYPTHADLVKHILEINHNDYQFWHLGNTLTWAPFRDLELTKMVLQMSPENMLGQVLDARLNRRMIELLWPRALDYISTHKNKNNRENLYLLYQDLG
jgi:asparagine synthetase B (glutamine-hydrolysing)